MNNIDEYQKWTRTTVVYASDAAPREGSSLVDIMYCGLGLAGEAGEVADKVKKLYRDGYSPLKRAEICKELGDVAWYMARLADEFQLPLSEVLQQNIDKLNQRKATNKLHGSGDNR